MDSDKNAEAGETSRSMSEQRMERARKSGKRNVLIALLVVAVGLAGAGYYWFQVLSPQMAQEAYTEETNHLVSTLQNKVRSMTEWTDENRLSNIAIEVNALSDREGVDPELVERLATKIGELSDLRASRAIKFMALLDEAGAMSLKASRSEVYAFDETFRLAKSAFQADRYRELKSVWSKRRKEIVGEASVGSGGLTIRSSPSKASVFMDGEFLAITPFSVGSVRAGDREIVIRKDGYRDKQVTIAMNAGGKIDLGIQDLEPISGSLTISVKGGKKRDLIEVDIQEQTESAAEVAGLELLEGYQFFNGREHSLEALKIGSYTLTVSRNGKYVLTREFVVEKNKLTELSIEI